MDNLLRKVESEDIVIYTDQIYSTKVLQKCKEIHQRLVEEGKLEGIFDSNKWMGYSGVKKFGIDFSIDEKLYESHVGKLLGISIEKMKNMIRCYAIYCNGLYIYSTIGRIKINTIKEFLTRYQDKNFKLDSSAIDTIEDFLGFIGTPNTQIEKITNMIRHQAPKIKTQRKLSPIINYLVIGNEINDIYKNNCDDETFVKWFPIYFWTNITFILPLRATEMLVTPKNCIFRENGKVYLRIRRTILKRGKKTVYYDVKKDYKEFTYEIPDNEVVWNIEKYLRLTEEQNRRFLFAYNSFMVNEMLSLQTFNFLLESFIEECIIGNRKYDFAKYASGIDEFEVVTAGDSRPIAMANLYFQDAGEDICRQLANHVRIDTSAGYYTNISETIWASSIIQMQKKLEHGWENKKEEYEIVNLEKSICISPKRITDQTNLDDCIEQGHLSECMGCKYYRPTKAELDKFLESEGRKADESAHRVIEFMNNILKIKEQDDTLEEVFLMAQTYGFRYRMGCEMKAEEVAKECLKHKNSQKTFY